MWAVEPWWEEMSGSVGEWKGLYRVSLPAIQMVVRVEGGVDVWTEFKEGVEKEKVESGER